MDNEMKLDMETMEKISGGDAQRDYEAFMREMQKKYGPTPDIRRFTREETLKFQRLKYILFATPEDPDPLPPEQTVDELFPAIVKDY